jgi:hypothetical protein
LKDASINWDCQLYGKLDNLKLALSAAI